MLGAYRRSLLAGDFLGTSPKNRLLAGSYTNRGKSGESQPPVDRAASARLPAGFTAMKSAALFSLLVVALAGCAYVGTATKQAYYSVRQPLAPRQRVYKHMLDRDTYFVFGKIEAGSGAAAGAALAVVALSDAFKPGEVVDVNQTSRNESYYGLNLPVGEYHLFTVCDRNGDGFFDEHEIIGRRTVTLSRETAPEKVLGGCDIAAGVTEPPGAPFRVAVRPAPVRVESLFYPMGTIRTLDDPIFAPEMGSLGLYKPAAFMEAAPMMFYALEEDAGYKVPVVFVHGIGGSARDFMDILASLDRRRYRPWFFDYPSGTDLKQLSAMFYRLFLSGSVIPKQETPMVIVAYSMGGLVVRDAFNRCTGKKSEADVRCLITIASPLGGMPAAASGTHAPVVIPSWRDLDPASPFIRDLHRRPLPAATAYHLYYTFANTGPVKLGENSDGVVPLSSQFCGWAQSEAKEQFGFNDTHTGVVHNPDAIRRIVQAIETVKSPFPDDHLRVLDTGGYPVPAGGGYTPIEAWCVQTMGRYMDALVAGELKPIHPLQEHFVAACRGQCAPNVPAERAWLKYNQERAGHRGSE